MDNSRKGNIKSPSVVGIKDTDKCTFCNLEKETLYHLLYRCTRVIIFWRHLEVWLNTTGNFNVKISEEHVLFGDLSEALYVCVFVENNQQFMY